MSKNKKYMLKLVIVVKVISGFHKNETGEVIKINQKTGKLLVQRN